MSLNGKVVLITGAGRGIGRAIALAFAGEGARVAATGRNMQRLAETVDEIRAGGGTAAAFELDVTNDEDAVGVANQVAANWGRIDILVNNAGVITYNTPVWATTIEQWDQVMNTNLRGTFLVSRAVIPQMMQRQEGVIINVGSSSGRQPDSDYGAYATSKWGVVGYTASLAHSLHPHGIRVNGINPGWVDTDMARENCPRGNPEWITGEQIAQAALYLATRAPNAMTGQFIDIFGV
ncbi:MAG: SDR family NAD(P)-dependent oxidoreductase [Chloroflexi bacterium]|nr:SDR family NAD(P)-dependent oxidoreductase [Chloroflexota bacterium]